METMDFNAALADSEQFSKRHLLLGNGFSIACCPEIFHYSSLFDQADFSSLLAARQVFEALKTTDFEIVINVLERGAEVLPFYSESAGLASERMLDDARKLKELLVTTVAKNHPAGPFEIPDEKLWSCRAFLNNFIGKDCSKAGHVFTLNYDLLLYWTVMCDGDPDSKSAFELKKNDGFDNDEANPTADYVVWQGETNANSPNIYYLHGALHLFGSGSELQKYTWNRSGERLVDQARAAIGQNKFPLFVSEGESKHKKNRIRHNAYLYQGFKTLTANAKTGTHCFFIFGHSLAENDDHIFLRLAKGKFEKMYVGLYGDPESHSNARIRHRAESLASLRGSANPLYLDFFDSESAHVWG